MPEQIEQSLRRGPWRSLLLFAEAAAATFAAIFRYDLLEGRSAFAYGATAVLFFLLAPMTERLWARLERRSRVIVMVASVLYSAGWCIGLTYMEATAYEAADHRLRLLLVHLACSVVLFRALIVLALGLAERVRRSAPTGERDEGRLVRTFLAIIVVGAALYTVSFYPGVSFWDGQRQLNEFFGVWPPTNHHPVLSTTIIGCCQWLGRTLVDDNFGMFLYNLLVTAYSIAIFRLVAKLQIDVRTPSWFTIATGCYFAFLPIVRLYSLTVCKDTSYAITLLWLVLLLYRLYLARVRQDGLAPGHGALGRGFLAQFVACVTLLCLLRNDGMYVVLFTLAGVVVFCLRARSRRAAAYAGACAAYVIVLHFAVAMALLPTLGVAAGNPGEALSVPIQQVAFTTREHPDDVTDEERRVIEGAFGVTPERIAEDYIPGLSDPVKNRFLSEGTTGDIKSFMGAWWSMFQRHPSTFVKAYVNGYWGYFYPTAFGDESGFTTFEPSRTANTGYFDFHYPEALAPLKAQMNDVGAAVRAIPLVSLLYCPGFYNWTLLFVITTALMRRRYSSLVVLLPIVATMGIVCLSPVNCRIRYVLPLVFCLPVMLTLVVGKVRLPRPADEAQTTSERSGRAEDKDTEDSDNAEGVITKDAKGAKGEGAWAEGAKVTEGAAGRA